MNLAWLNTVRNTRRALTGRSGYAIQRINGFSLPELDHFAARSPRQHGSIYQGTFFRSRECSIELALVGCDPATFEAKHRDLVQIMNPLDAGQLLIIDSNGDTYTLNARPSAAIAVNRADPRISFLLIQLTADDPFFYGPQVSVAYEAVAEPLLAIPFTIPATITGGASVVFNVTNEGHLKTFPIITIEQPGLYQRLVVTNLTSGESLIVEPSSGSPGVFTTTEIDMAGKTVDSFPGSGVRTSLLAFTSGTFWGLDPGTASIKIQTAQATTRSGSVTFSARYLAVV